jgi:hypothetical protein
VKFTFKGNQFKAEKIRMDTRIEKFEFKKKKLQNNLFEKVLFHNVVFN